MTRNIIFDRSSSLKTMVAIAALLSLAQTGAWAAPVGGQVGSGQASITANGAVTTVLQASDRAVVDWSSFNLAADETARFIVPNSTSATLNRITGGGVSTISGTIQSNGIVYFSNPNGLVFDASSRVSANGFFATTSEVAKDFFMNRREFLGVGQAGIILNGTIAAPAILVRAGTVTVGGALSAGSGRIDIASTNLTTIGQGAVISADGESRGTAGTVRLWSDGQMDYYGQVSATGWDGGFVEVSGRQSLNFQGRVDTRGAGGKTGTLLLDPATIEIVTTAGGTAGISYITVANLVAALSTNTVTIDANQSTTSGLGGAPVLGTGGSGTITLLNDLTATVGAFALTLTGSAISLRANLSLPGDLILNSTRASVWQDSGTSITAASLGGSSVDGFFLRGANHLGSLGAITNRGSGGISVTNAQALTVGAGALDGGSGRVAILTPGFDLTVVAPASVKGQGFRLDLGSGRLLGGQTVTVRGGDAFVTVAAVGNLATIDLGGGDFVSVLDQRVGNAIFSFTEITPPQPSFPLATSGLTVTTTGSTAELGVVTAGVVFLEGIRNGPSRNLRYIEGLGIGTLNGDSAFSGSLVLVANGPRFGLAFNGQGKLASLLLTAGLSTGTAGDRTSNLTLIQTGDSTANGIDIEAVAVTAGGSLSLSQTSRTDGFGIWLDSPVLQAGSGVTIAQSGSSALNGIHIASTFLTTTDLTLVQTGVAVHDGISSLNLSAKLSGNLTVTQSGIAGDSGISLIGSFLGVNGNTIIESSGTVGFLGVDLNGVRLATDGDLLISQTGKAAIYGVISSDSSLAAGGDLTISQSGQAGLDGLIFDLGGVTAGGNLTLTQSGSALSNGIVAAGVDFKAGGDLTIEQSGSVGIGASGIVLGIEPLVASGGIKGVGLAAGPTNQIIISTNNSSLTLKNGDDFAVTGGGKLRIDLGSGGLVSSLGPIPAGGYSLKTMGQEVFFTGATSGNSAQINVGDGSFTFVNDQRSITTMVTLDDTTTATTPGSGWGTGLGALVSGTASGGLTIINNGPVSSINSQSAIFGGPVTIDGVTTGPAHLLTYIEGSTIIVSGAASSFAANLTLVASGSGSEAGIAISTGLSTGVANDGTSSLILRQSGNITGSGIVITSSTITAGGNLSLEQTGVAGANGIKLEQARLVAGGSLILSQTGTSGQTSPAIAVKASSLVAGSDIILGQSATGSAAGIVLEATGTTVADAVAFRAGGGRLISLQTLNRNLSLVGFDNFALNGSRVRLQLGTGQVTSLDGAAAAIAAPGFTIKASGADVFFSGAASGNRAAVAVGSGSFTWVSDQSSLLLPATLSNTTTLGDLGLEGVVFGGAAGSRTVAGLVVSGSRDAALTGLGVQFGGTVIIDGVQTGAARSLTFVEGKGIGVLFGASSFAGSLTLVSDGAGITDAAGENAGGILVEANLNLGTIDDGVSHLTLVQSGKSANNGIAIATAKLQAGGDIMLRQQGIIDPGFIGIVLLASGSGPGQRVELIAGRQARVVLETANQTLQLFQADGFTVSARRLEIALGSGDFSSFQVGGGGGAGNFTLSAPGSEVIFSGALSGNDATIAVGSGTFTWVKDSRAATSAVTIDNASTLASLGLGGQTYGGGVGSRTIAGLTITGSQDAALQGLGLRLGGSLTIDGVSSSDVRSLTYLEAAGITVTNSSSTFSHGLQLVASATTDLSIAADLTTADGLSLTTVGGAITLGKAGGLQLTSGTSGTSGTGGSGGLTITAASLGLTSSVGSAGGAVVIDLGQGGVYSNGAGAGFSLDSSLQNLSITAGSIANPAASAAIFKLGSGTLTAGGGLAIATRVTLPALSFGGGYITSLAEEARFTSGSVVYYFTSDSGSALAADQAAVNDPNGYWLDASALNAASLGSKTVASGAVQFQTSGFSGGSGDIGWRNSGDQIGTSTTTSFSLANGRAVHFFQLVGQSLPVTPPSWLATASSVTFDGANSFSGGLTLASAGAIRQSAGASLTVTGGDLVITGSSAIALSNGGNRVTSLGSLTSSGSIAVTNDGDLSLNGAITTTGAGATIGLVLRNDSRLSLSRAMVSSGGAVTLALGGGTYDSLNGAAATTAGLAWTTTNQPLSITVGTVNAGTGALFIVGSGQFTSDLSFAQGFGTNLYFSNDPAVNRDTIQTLTDDPTAEFHRLSDLNGIKTGGFLTTNGVVTFQTQISLPSPTATLTFWNVRNGSVVTNADFAALGFAGTIRFAGRQNSFSQWSVATGPLAQMVVAEATVLSGSITVVARGLRVQPRAVLSQGTIASASGTDLRLVVEGDFEQMSSDASFDAGANRLVIESRGGSVQLLNPRNRFGTLAVATGGGNLRINSDQSLSFAALATDGGFVVLDTRGSISGSGLATGRVSFRAGGSVKLSGSFVGADGSGQSVELNNAAVVTVLGSIRSDGSVTVNGPGSTILTGDIVGNSVVAFATPVTVAHDSTVVTNGGRIEFARSVAALNRVVGLRLDSGYGGVIALGGSLGSPDLSLGWVELNGLVSDPGGFGVYYLGGSLLGTGLRLRNWRNGQGL